MIQPFVDAVPILEQLERAGYEAYFVGGSVRDYMRNEPIHDVDIATSATPEEVKEIFPKTVDLGIEHGTILVHYDGTPYEVTTFRTETEYKDYRRPDSVIFIRSLREDLRRRDFTMNAIALASNGELIDPFEGESAIKNKQIVTVGEAADRFNEDALRMMRAVRFISQLEFSIEKKTKAALKQHGHLLTNISMERITAEFERLLLGKGARQALRVLVETDLHKYLPGLEDKGQQLLQATTYEWGRLSIAEIWTLLLYCCQTPDEEVKRFLKQWKLPVKQMNETRQLLAILRTRLLEAWTVETLYQAKRANVEKVERLFTIIEGTSDKSIDQAVAQFNQLPIQQTDQLQVNGRHLMAWLDRRGGPWLQTMLTTIELLVLKGELANEREAIKEWVERCNQT